MRTAKVNRTTNETAISVELAVDGRSRAEINSGIGFFDHMLDQLAKHAKIDLTLKAEGDLHVDPHHSVEDCAIVLGRALTQALGDKRGIRRYACSYAPMDEALTRVVIDISGRSHLSWQVHFTTAMIGDLPSELIREWFEGLARSAAITIHVTNIYGYNNHHIAESCFKGLALALRSAMEIDPKAKDSIPSSKGCI